MRLKVKVRVKRVRLRLKLRRRVKIKGKLRVGPWRCDVWAAHPAHDGLVT